MEHGEIIIQAKKNDIIIFEKKYNNVITIEGTKLRTRRLTDRITVHSDYPPPPSGETEASPPISLVIIGWDSLHLPYDKTITTLREARYWSQILTSEVTFGYGHIDTIGDCAWIEITKTFTNTQLGQFPPTPPDNKINEIGFFHLYRSVITAPPEEWNEGNTPVSTVLAGKIIGGHSYVPILHAYVELPPGEELTYDTDINITITRRLYSPF